MPAESVDLLPLKEYDHVVVFTSGGKDSMATMLLAMECGLKDRIIAHHHLVDGREGSTLMDWPITESYIEEVCHALSIPLDLSWREGGIERELLRQPGQATAPIHVTTHDGRRWRTGGKGPPSKDGRMKFPQVTADLRTRWCTPVVKIDVGRSALSTDPLFDGKKVLVITGERAEESPGRAKYLEEELHRCNAPGRKKRLVHAWRPVHKWPEKDVWEIMERWKVRPHPAYELGFGRCSCMTCIFGSANQWATIRMIDPGRFERIAQLEEQFNCTINRTKSVRVQADKGTPYPAAVERPDLVKLALSRHYLQDVLVTNWALPAGAFGESAGPT